MKQCFTLLILITSFNFSYGQNLKDDDFNSLEKEIQKTIGSKKIPSVVIAVAKNDKILYENAFGYSDIENNIKATITTSYQLASVSKTFTATGIMILNRQKKIDINSPATKYMSSIKFNEIDGLSSDVKIIDLLNHTSGLGTYFQLNYSNENTKQDSFEEAFQKYGSLFHPSGQVYEYSNLGYGLLDYIIAEQSGTTFSKFMKKELFTPLDLNNTFVGNADLADRSIAKKYDTHLNVLPNIENNTKGAGNIYSSIHDLISFGMFHLNDNENNVLSRKELTLMRNYNNKNILYHNYDETYYGLGWNFKPDDNGYDVAWHEGGMMGASSMLKLIPDENIAIAVILNTFNQEYCQYLLNLISKIVLPDYNPTPINPVANYQNYSSDSSYFGKWKGDIKVDEISIPCTLNINPDGTIIINYLDHTYKSYFTKNNPINNKTFLSMGLVNDNYFLGLYLGNLPSKDIRHEFSQFLSLKLVKKGNILSGTVVALPAAEREYYAYPYYIKLQKE